MATPSYIQCRFCAWKTARWSKERKPVGQQRLSRHVEDCHEDELFALHGVSSWETLAAKLEVEASLDDYCEKTIHGQGIL